MLALIFLVEKWHKISTEDWFYEIQGHFTTLANLKLDPSPIYARGCGKLGWGGGSHRCARERNRGAGIFWGLNYDLENTLLTHAIIITSVYTV